jgi:hypothetical protein
LLFEPLERDLGLRQALGDGRRAGKPAVGNCFDQMVAPLSSSDASSVAGLLGTGVPAPG